MADFLFPFLFLCNPAELTIRMWRPLPLLFPRYFCGDGPGERVLRLPLSIAHRSGWDARRSLSDGIGFGAPQLRRTFGIAHSRSVSASRDFAVDKYLAPGKRREASETASDSDPSMKGECSAVVLREVRRINGSLLTVTIRRCSDCVFDYTKGADAAELQVEAFDHETCAIHALVCMGSESLPSKGSLNTVVAPLRTRLARRIGHILGIGKLTDGVVERCVGYLAEDTLRTRRDLSHLAARAGKDRATAVERMLVRKMARVMGRNSSTENAIVVNEEKILACAHALRAVAHVELQEVRAIAASVTKFGVERACASISRIVEVRFPFWQSAAFSVGVSYLCARCFFVLTTYTPTPFP